MSFPEHTAHQPLTTPRIEQAADRAIWAEFALLLAAWLLGALIVIGALLGPANAPPAQAATTIADTHSAQFAKCGRAKRVTCIVDGDTLWFRGEKIRLADIDTPETHRPACPREARLGRDATARLTQLANAGPFTLAPMAGERDRDHYGRSLRVISREGRSLGAQLVREGLAAQWGAPPVDWCAV